MLKKKAVFDNRTIFNRRVGDAFALLLLSPPTPQTEKKTNNKHKDKANCWTPSIRKERKQDFRIIFLMMKNTTASLSCTGITQKKS